MSDTRRGRAREQWGGQGQRGYGNQSRESYGNRDRESWWPSEFSAGRGYFGEGGRERATDRGYGPRSMEFDNTSYGNPGYGGSGSYGGGMGSYGGGMGTYGERGRHTGRGPKGYRRSDERIREDVNERLTQHPEIDASDIEVEVKDGNVTLTGTVDDRSEKRMAEDVAEAVSGVQDVHNQLRVQQRQSAGGEKG